MNRDRLTTIAMFAVALAVLSVVVWFSGVDGVLGALGAANTPVIAVIVAVAAVWLSAWGLALWTVLKAIGAPISAPKSVFVFSAAVFSNNVTPFGQAGGEPVSALLISTAADSEYETGLAAIASVDTLHFVPSVGFSVIGLVYVLAGAAELTDNIALAALGVVVLVAVILTAATLGWRYRERVEAGLVRLITPVVRTLAYVVPRWSPPTAADIERRIEGFLTAVGRVANDRWTIVVAVGFSALGWLALSTSLWLSLYALGHPATPITFGAALFVVPVGSIAGVTPLPGGLGGLEAAFITLLIPTAGVSVSVATAAVLIHRGATYWLPTLFGGGAATVLGNRARK
ncbi:MAG: flippase-like domain-containing protein [Haloarculaceae archaeon]